MQSRNNAKYFRYKEGNKKGIISYTAKNDKTFPKFEINKNTSKVYKFGDVHESYKNGNTLIQFDTYPNVPAYLMIDFGNKYKASISSYIIDMNKENTPPNEWDVSGKNDENEEWTIISSPPATDHLCGFDNSVSRCTNATTNKFMTNSDELFRYVRFRVIKARLQAFPYYRVNMFEIFGYITGFISCKTIYNRYKSNHFVIMIMISIVNS